MPHNVHDVLFKSTFSQIEHAAAALRALLPLAIVARIDFTALALVPGSFVDEIFEERHTDLLFTVTLDGRVALLYVLFEHQSQNDALMAFRLLVYMVRIWERWLKEHPRAKRLPPILPVVLHHSEKGWEAATAFEELLDVEPATLAALGAHVPRMRFVLDDISHVSDEALRARAMTALGRLALFCLRHGRTPEDLLERLAGWRDLVREVRRAPHGAAALAAIWRYIFAVNEKAKPEELVARLLAAAGEDGKEEIVTVADQLREEGFKKGEERTLKRTLLKLLDTRFGALPEALVARVSAADPAQLDRWLERVFSAQSPAEVLGDS